MIEDAYLKQGLLKATKNWVKATIRKNVLNTWKQVNSHDIYDKKLSHEYDLQFEEKAETYVDKLDFLKKLEIVDNDESQFYSTRPSTKICIWTYIENFENIENYVDEMESDIYQHEIEVS